MGLVVLELNPGQMKSLNVRSVLDVLAYSDGTNSVDDLSDRLGISIDETSKILETLIEEELVLEI